MPDLTAQQVESITASLMKAVAAQKTDSKVSREEKIKLLQAIASDPAARKAYCSSRASVILPLIPYQSTVRSIFQPEVLAPGAQAYYPINFDYTEVATFMPKMGGFTARILEGDEIYIPTFGIEAAVRYNIDIAEQGRIDIAEQSTRELSSRITAKEELAGWATIKGTLSGLNTNQNVFASGSTVNYPAFTKQSVNKMIVQMDVQRRELTDIYASPRSIADLREWTTTQIDYLTQREIFVNGGLPGGKIWDINLHKVYDSSLVADTEAWGFDVRSLGKMPIQKELTTYEDPTAILQWQIGTMARERVGFGITDSWAMVKMNMQSNHTTAVVPAAY